VYSRLRIKEGVIYSAIELANWHGDTAHVLMASVTQFDTRLHTVCHDINVSVDAGSNKSTQTNLYRSFRPFLRPSMTNTPYIIDFRYVAIICISLLKINESSISNNWV